MSESSAPLGSAAGTHTTAPPGAVRSILVDHAVDVLCLQEVHFYNGDADPQLLYELREAGLGHFAGLPLSESHLDSSAQLGVGIASRFPLSQRNHFFLTRPDLTANVRGQVWTLHEKGMIGCSIQLPSAAPVWLFSLHLFPFFEFGVQETDEYVDRMWQEFWEHCDALADSADVILAGDFNQQHRERAAGRWSRRRWQFCFTRTKTTSTGMALDEVALSWPSPGSTGHAVPTFSDHYLAIAEVELETGGPWSVPADAVVTGGSPQVYPGRR